MADRITKTQRSRNMAKVKSKDTSPEMKVRKWLYARGHRYRIHYKVAGKPDVAFVKKKVAVFIHGCFWHQHSCKKARLPKTNKRFWKEKLLGNKKRDKQTLLALQKSGWKTFVIWECEIKDNAVFEQKMNGLVKML